MKVGEKIGPYVLQKRLGAGGFGEVWRVEDSRNQTILAVKILELEEVDDRNAFLNDFLREVQFWAAAGGHPNVHLMLRAEVYDDVLLLISACADSSLKDWLKAQGGKAPSLGVAVEMTAAILSGLEHLHTRTPPILHRDLKPANILLFRHTPKIADLGLSRGLVDGSHIRLSRQVATWEYAASEVYNGEYRVESDLWSVGVMLYEMLMGHRPFVQPPGPALMGAVMNGRSVPLSDTFPAWLREVVERSLATDAKDRYPSAQAMREALSPTRVAGSIRVNPKDGAAMVYIPAGPFLMGDDDRSDNPCHTVNLSGYWMYKNLVTVDQYKKFCKATGKEMPPAPDFNPNWSKDDHPIVRVNWDDALAYAKWAGVELPTEAQWEKAARSTDGRKYPWGNDWDTRKLWCSKKEWGDSGGTHKVGELGLSPYGCTDMAGNVWQWCRDWYDADYWKSDRGKDPENTDRQTYRVLRGRQTYRVLRGGSWDSKNPDDFRAAFRYIFYPTSRFGYVGLRCVVRADY